jgi:hypothetical protein
MINIFRCIEFIDVCLSPFPFVTSPSRIRLLVLLSVIQTVCFMGNKSSRRHVGTTSTHDDIDDDDGSSSFRGDHHHQSYHTDPKHIAMARSSISWRWAVARQRQCKGDRVIHEVVVYAMHSSPPVVTVAPLPSPLHSSTPAAKAIPTAAIASPKSAGKPKIPALQRSSSVSSSASSSSSTSGNDNSVLPPASSPSQILPLADDHSVPADDRIVAIIPVEHTIMQLAATGSWLAIALEYHSIEIWSLAELEPVQLCTIPFSMSLFRIHEFFFVPEWTQTITIVNNITGDTKEEHKVYAPWLVALYGIDNEDGYDDAHCGQRGIGCWPMEGLVTRQSSKIIATAPTSPVAAIPTSPTSSVASPTSWPLLIPRAPPAYTHITPTPTPPHHNRWIRRLILMDGDKHSPPLIVAVIQHISTIHSYGADELMVWQLQGELPSPSSGTPHVQSTPSSVILAHAAARTGTVYYDLALERPPIHIFRSGDAIPPTYDPRGSAAQQRGQWLDVQRAIGPSSAATHWLWTVRALADTIPEWINVRTGVRRPVNTNPSLTSIRGIRTIAFDAQVFEWNGCFESPVSSVPSLVPQSTIRCLLDRFLVWPVVLLSASGNKIERGGYQYKRQNDVIAVVDMINKHEEARYVKTPVTYSNIMAAGNDWLLLQRSEPSNDQHIWLTSIWLWRITLKDLIATTTTTTTSIGGTSKGPTWSTPSAHIPHAVTAGGVMTLTPLPLATSAGDTVTPSLHPVNSGVTTYIAMHAHHPKVPLQVPATTTTASRIHEVMCHQLVGSRANGFHGQCHGPLPVGQHRGSSRTLLHLREKNLNGMDTWYVWCLDDYQYDSECHSRQTINDGYDGHHNRACVLRLQAKDDFRRYFGMPSTALSPSPVVVSIYRDTIIDILQCQHGWPRDVSSLMVDYMFGVYLI